MKPSSPAILNVSRAVLRTLIVANLICLFLFIGVLALTWIGEARFTAALIRSGGPEAGPLLAAVRTVMLIGIMAVPLAHLVLSRLLAIVETVRGGEPFARDNARRLTVIAWALLGLQLLDLAFGAVALSAPGAKETGFDGWTFSLTGWLAVLLLFVLARAFAQGTRLQEDAEGTV